MADDKAVKAAQEAWATARPNHVLLLTWSAWKSGTNAQPDDWNDTLQQATAIGWRVANWSVVSDHRGNPAGFALLAR